MAEMKKFVVVGAGLAGSLVTRVLRKAGHEVVVIDDQDRFSASEASSNLYIGSWLKKFSSMGAARGLQVLKALELPESQVFDRGIADALKVRHIAQRDVLVTPQRVETVEALSHHGVYTRDAWGALYHEKGIPVLCCGHRGAELAPSLAGRIDVKVGHAFLFKGVLPKGKSTLEIVAPYKHGKLYQFDANHIYYADSVAVKLSSYLKRAEELKERTLERAYTHFSGMTEVADFRVGYRPIIKGADFGICERTEEGAFVINGGGKNGMVAYCNAAAELLGMLD